MRDQFDDLISEIYKFNEVEQESKCNSPSQPQNFVTTMPPAMNLVIQPKLCENINVYNDSPMDFSMSPSMKSTIKRSRENSVKGNDTRIHFQLITE